MKYPGDQCPEKDAVRRRVLQSRRALDDRATRSQQICQRVTRWESYLAAGCILVYVSAGTEVSTLSLLTGALCEKRVLVPWCDGDELRLFHLCGMDELTRGAFGIPEPTDALRRQISRWAEPCDVDVALVPGVAFDRRGARLGHGKGYFDRLLGSVREGCVRAGLAFECQLVDVVPVECHDIAMDAVFTELGCYRPSDPR